MPTYDYRCDKCKTKEQHFHKMTEDKIYLCEQCKSKMVKCIGAGIGVHFHGTGFYATDYK